MREVRASLNAHTPLLFICRMLRTEGTGTCMQSLLADKYLKILNYVTSVYFKESAISSIVRIWNILQVDLLEAIFFSCLSLSTWSRKCCWLWRVIEVGVGKEVHVPKKSTFCFVERVSRDDRWEKYKYLWYMYLYRKSPLELNSDCGVRMNDAKTKHSKTKTGLLVTVETVLSAFSTWVYLIIFDGLIMDICSKYAEWIECGFYSWDHHLNIFSIFSIFNRLRISYMSVTFIDQVHPIPFFISPLSSLFSLMTSYALFS